jgi:hypothetical protein
VSILTWRKSRHQKTSLVAPTVKGSNAVAMAVAAVVVSAYRRVTGFASMECANACPTVRAQMVAASGVETMAVAVNAVLAPQRCAKTHATLTLARQAIAMGRNAVPMELGEPAENARKVSSVSKDFVSLKCVSPIVRVKSAAMTDARGHAATAPPGRPARQGNVSVSISLVAKHAVDLMKFVSEKSAVLRLAMRRSVEGTAATGHVGNALMGCSARTGFVGPLSMFGPVALVVMLGTVLWGSVQIAVATFTSQEAIAATG